VIGPFGLIGACQDTRTDVSLMTMTTGGSTLSGTATRDINTTLNS